MVGANDTRAEIIRQPRHPRLDWYALFALSIRVEKLELLSKSAGKAFK